MKTLVTLTAIVIAVAFALMGRVTRHLRDKRDGIDNAIK